MWKKMEHRFQMVTKHYLLYLMEKGRLPHTEVSNKTCQNKTGDGFFLVAVETCCWKLCTYGSLKMSFLTSVRKSVSLFLCSFFFPLTLFSNSSLLYLKLTLSSFIHQERFSEGKVVGDLRKSKRGAWITRRKRGGERSERVREQVGGVELEMSEKKQR